MTFLNLTLEPHGHSSLRRTFALTRAIGAGRTTRGLEIAAMGKLLDILFATVRKRWRIQPVDSGHLQ